MRQATNHPPHPPRACASPGRRGWERVRGCRRRGRGRRTAAAAGRACAPSTRVSSPRWSSTTAAPAPSSPSGWISRAGRAATRSCSRAPGGSCTATGVGLREPGCGGGAGCGLPSAGGHRRGELAAAAAGLPRASPAGCERLCGKQQPALRDRAARPRRPAGGPAWLPSPPPCSVTSPEPAAPEPLGSFRCPARPPGNERGNGCAAAVFSLSQVTSGCSGTRGRTTGSSSTSRSCSWRLPT